MARIVTTAKNRFFYGYWIIFAGFVTLSLNEGFAFYGFSILNKPISDEFGWNRATVTAAFFVYFIAAAAVSPIVGRLTDKRGARQVLLVGIIVMVLSLFLLSYTSNVWAFYLLYLFVGLAYMLMGPIPVSVVISKWFYRMRGTMQGIAFVGLGFGGLTLSPIIGNYLMPNLGWRTTYTVMALATAIIMLPLILILVKDNPQKKGLLAYGQPEKATLNDTSPKVETKSSLTLKEYLRNSTFWIILVTTVIYGMVTTAGIQNQVSILSEQGFPMAEAVFAIGIIGLFSAIGKFTFGFLCDHINARYSTAIAYTLSASSLVMLITAHSTLQVWAYAVLAGLGMGGWAANLSMLTTTYFGLKRHGAVLGAFYLSLNGGSAVGPVLGGFAYDQTGNYRPMLLALAIACFLCVPIISTIRKRQVRPD